MEALGVSIFPLPGLREALSRHPHIGDITENDGRPMSWKQGAWSRSIYLGSPSVEPRGLVELIDNNPMVCADDFSVPTAASTLALIALGPLARAGLLIERPTLTVNVSAHEEDVRVYLGTMGWTEGCTLSSEPTDLEGVAAATAIAAIRNPDSFEELDALYDEAFSRSFFVRREEESDWHVGLVKDKPYAVYRLRITPGDTESLLTVRVMADQHGKCGAAQIVHAFNVMAGFEESLGLLDC